MLKLLGEDLSALRARMFKPLRVALHPIVEEQLKAYGAETDTRKRGRWARAPGDASELGSASELTAEQKLKARDLDLMNSRTVQPKPAPRPSRRALLTPQVNSG